MKALRGYTRRAPLHVGDRIGRWEVIRIEGSDAYVRCDCGAERYKRISQMQHDQSKQCRACRVKNRKQQASNLHNVPPDKIYAVIKSLSEQQRKYAVALLRSRAFIENTTLSRMDVLEAIEMARAIGPDEIEAAHAALSPKFVAETHQRYRVYESPVQGFTL